MVNNLQDIVAYYQGIPVGKRQFLQHVNAVYNDIPEHRFVINLCEDRYRYMVAFMACMMKGQTTLLPSNRAEKEIERIGHIYRDSYIITDQNDFNSSLSFLNIDINTTTQSQELQAVPDFDENHTAIVVFTSGSTGIPQAHQKQWGELVLGARLTQKRFDLFDTKNTSIIATVPPQHMFGFEMGVVLPIVTGIKVLSSKPFFPFDIRRELSLVPGKKILVTTPIHLNTCRGTDISWPDVDMVISAAAPLSQNLAQDIERIMSTQVCEIYGCSETGAIATRNTCKDELWKLYEGYEIGVNDNHVWFSNGLTEEKIKLSDKIDVMNSSTFRLLGRGADFINIGGKRGSLGDLSHKLRKIPGVDDGVFILPEEKEDQRTRLAALVVAPKLSEKDILRHLGKEIDDVFLPRPIRKVGFLPYNENGKLPRQKLLDMLYGRDVPLKESWSRNGS